MKKKQFSQAQEIIEDNPKLAQDLLGRETLARIAMLQGDLDLADSLYASLERESSEAKSYLARRAFAEKNWKRARVLTQELLKQHPSNKLLIDNLKKIHEEEKKQKGIK